jgi:hypothetical protein
MSFIEHVFWQDLKGLCLGMPLGEKDSHRKYKCSCGDSIYRIPRGCMGMRSLEVNAEDKTFVDVA